MAPKRATIFAVLFGLYLVASGMCAHIEAVTSSDAFSNSSCTA